MEVEGDELKVGRVVGERIVLDNDKAIEHLTSHFYIKFFEIILKIKSWWNYYQICVRDNLLASGPLRQIDTNNWAT